MSRLDEWQRELIDRLIARVRPPGPGGVRALVTVPSEMHSPSELAYLIFRVLDEYVDAPSSEACIDAIGALDIAEREFLRRRVDPVDDILFRSSEVSEAADHVTPLPQADAEALEGFLNEAITSGGRRYELSDLRGYEVRYLFDRILRRAGGRSQQRGTLSFRPEDTPGLLALFGHQWARHRIDPERSKSWAKSTRKGKRKRKKD